MRTTRRFLALAAVLAGGAGVGGAFALGQGGVGGRSSGVGAVGPGTTVTATSTPPGPAGSPKARLGGQTHPAVAPRRGSPRTRFAVRLTLADAPGHAGVIATGYRLQLTAPAGKAIRRCSPAAPAEIDSGLPHQVVRVELLTPAGGWCTGRYTLTVLLQRGPYCPKPSSGPPTPCPEFPDRVLNVGTAHFTVATKH